VLNELNVQSVVTAPAHDEMIPLSASGTYTVKGFAYSGACNLLHANLITDTFHAMQHEQGTVCSVRHICQTYLSVCIVIHIDRTFLCQ